MMRALPDNTRYVLRGGGYGSAIEDLATARAADLRFDTKPESSYRGFRCVQDAFVPRRRFLKPSAWGHRAFDSFPFKRLW